MDNFLFAFGFALLGYLCGSLPFAIWVTRLVKGMDVRDAGSGHATTTNTIRQAGFGWGALVLVLDIAKGFLPTWLAVHYAPVGWMVPLTAAMAVIGHCYPLFAGFRGGMGLATAGGTLFAVSFQSGIICLAVLITLVLVLKHGARAGVLTGIIAPLVMLLFGLRGVPVWVGVAVGLVIAFRFLIDWNRKYRELWLDREKPQAG
jgi:acyl phosphate:glycerol-3-phosphate acyltransferase